MAMKILIANDDGIKSPHLRRLAEWASGFAQVSVFAPAVEQSGKSHGIELKLPIEVTRIEDYLPGVEAYSVDSTPADCVRFAVLERGLKPDIVFSGINNGYNVGHDILYSGTAGATFEAALLGFKAVALSTDFGVREVPMSALDTVRAFFDGHRLLDRHGLYNVNISVPSKGIRLARQGGAFYSDDFTELEDGRYIAHGITVYEPNIAPDLDTDYVCSGYTTVTPLTVDRTDVRLFEELKRELG